VTTILGLQHRNGFTLAADSQTTSNDRAYLHPNLEKITKVGPLTIAGAGNARVCDVVQNTWTPPPFTKNDTPYKYMISKLIPSMRNAVEGSGYAPKEGDTFQFLIGVGGQLFEIAEDYTVLSTADRIYGIGSGAAYGIGAIAAGADIESAVKIAIKFDINSGGKIQIVKQGVNDA
jgi:hypothetical protein